MARPEDTLARGTARNGTAYDQGFNEPPAGSLRAQAPPRQPNPAVQQAMRPPAQPGLNPTFDPYMQQRPAQQSANRSPQDPRGTYPANAAPQGYAPDPYAAQRPPARQPVAAPMPPGPQGQTMRQQPAPAGYPPQQTFVPLQGQPRNPAPARPADSYDAVPASRRSREPFFEAPPSARQVPPRQQPAPAGLAQDGYGDDRYADSQTEADFADDDAGNDEDDTEYYPEEPAPRGRRTLFAALALTAFVALGGGAGAIYKYGFSHSGGKDSPPFVQADATPAKIIPAAAEQAADDGKKTILDRPDTAAEPPAVVASQEQVAVDSGNGQAADTLASPRKVATVIVKSGEKITAGAAPADTAQADAVPGIMIGNDDPAAKPMDQVKSKGKMVMAQAQQAVQAAAVPDQPAETAAAADPAPDQAPVKLGKTAKKVKVAAVTPPDPAVAATAAAPAHKVGGGYIIQVRSTKTQTEALAYFADLQQRFGDLLGAAQPDIQEADLGAKGKWYRLRIGPPGSGTAAKDLCTKLKASGLDACIVATY